MSESRSTSSNDHDLLIELRTMVYALNEKVEQIRSGDMAYCVEHEQRIKAVEEAVVSLRRIAEQTPSKESVARAHDRITSLQKALLAVAAFAAAEALAILKMLFMSGWKL